MKKSVLIAILFSVFNFQFGISQANLLNAKLPQEVGQLNEAQSSADNLDAIEYGYIDDRDVLWSKTVWETIDLNERINFPYYYPYNNNGFLSTTRRSLFRVLLDNIEAGEITEIYSSSYFNNKITFDELKSFLYLRRESELGKEKFNAGEELDPEDDYDVLEIKSDLVTQFRVKGTWYFNKRLGEMKYRLLGIAPLSIDVSTVLDEVPSTQLNELFWVWYPDARKSLSSAMVFNGRNSSQPVTFDNMLNSRRFNSIIYKEENVYEDREVKDYIYEDALRQLLESERIKSVIRDFEQDMWSN